MGPCKGFGTQWRVRLGLLCGLAFIAIYLAAVPTSSADHDEFGYKFPCNPADACWITQLAHTGNAFDFDPQGSAGLGDIRVVSEATFVNYVTQSSVCTWPDGSGLGKFAVMDDMHGRTLRYAHLSAFGSLPVDERILQGDKVGTEGNTGYSAGCRPALRGWRLIPPTPRGSR